MNLFKKSASSSSNVSKGSNNNNNNNNNNNAEPEEGAPPSASASGSASGSASSEEKKVDVSLRVQHAISNLDDGSMNVLVSLQPPAGVNRLPADICCVIDVSGSMQTEATLQNSQGARESHGLCLLDVVKHAVKTVIRSLKPTDRLALVAYSSQASVVFPLQAMDDKGKKAAELANDQLEPDGSTNLWDGLYTGLEELRKAAESNDQSKSGGRIASVLLLTDGQPNVEPPRGHIPMLQAYKDKNKMSTTINTFGFGYNLNSELLSDIAVEGHGMYVFIPDSGFVGTAFVNTTSNILVAMGNNATLQVEPLNGAKILPGGVVGHAHQITSWGASIQLGSLQFGQHKEAVIRVASEFESEGPFLKVTVKYEQIGTGQICELQGEAVMKKNQPEDRAAATEVECHYLRLLTSLRVREAIVAAKTKKLEDGQAIIKDLSQVIRRSPAVTTKEVSELLKDVDGQITEALSKGEFFNRWGVHYLPSLARAHLQQQCTNFKDVGIQQYAGQLFSQLRDVADAVFLKIPPPKSSSSHKKVTVTSMSSYHNSSNPCFAGDCHVLMANGTQKLIQDLSKGDQVHTPTGPAQVLCVVKTKCHQGMAPLVELEGGLLVTPYHPIKLDGQWYFPCNVGVVYERPCPAVYNFVLDAGHVLTINGVECVTLGHDLKEEVVAHPFFGSQAIVKSLSGLVGYTHGLVELRTGCLVRDQQTGLVCGLQQD